MSNELPKGAIGHKDDFVLENGAPDYEKLAGKHIDGATGFVFDTVEAYEEFKAPKASATPEGGEVNDEAPAAAPGEAAE